MAHFAEIDENNVVIRVIVADQEFIDSGLVGDPSRWIQTSYNTDAGQHRLGGTPLRKNYAGPGMKYDPVLDAFIRPQPYPSWLLNEEIGDWYPPVPYPDDGKPYEWDEATTSWIVDEKILRTWQQ